MSCRSKSVKATNTTHNHSVSYFLYKIFMAYMCKNVAHAHTQTPTPITASRHDHSHGFLHHFLLSSNCDLIGCGMGEAYCRGRKRGGGLPPLSTTHTHTHMTLSTHLYTHTHTGNPSVCNTCTVFSYTPLLNNSQHRQVRMCCTPASGLV